MSRPLLDLRLDVMSAKPHSHSLELWNKGIRIAKQCVCFWLSCVPENLFPHTNFRVLLETSTVPERSQQNRALCHKYSKWLILKINKEPLKTWWTWVWVNSGSCWWTGRPGVLWFMGSQGVRHNWATELNWSDPLQYSCLENSMDRGTWQAPAHGVTKSWTRLRD